MGCKIEISRSVPPATRAVVAPLVRKYRFMLPGWLNALSVRCWQNQNYDGESDDAAKTVAIMKVDWEYRQAALTIYPAFNDKAPSFQDLTIAHEFGHIINAPMETWGDTFIENAVADEGLRAFMKDDWRRMCEGAVEDMSAAIVRGLSA